MEPGTGYMLSSRVIFEKEFAINHDKCLDKANIVCKFRNTTDEALPVQKTRLFFNREVLPLGQVFIRVGDQLEMTFTVEESGRAEEDLQPFASYIFQVEELGFRSISG